MPRRIHRIAPALVVVLVALASTRAHAERAVGEASEALPLVRGAARPTVEVDALAATIIIRGATLPRTVSALCPRSERAGSGTALHCRSRRIQARIEQDGGRLVLVITRMLDTPAFDGDASMPLFTYASADLGLASCPTPAAAVAARPSVLGECALLSGHHAEALSHLALALEADDAAHAALRLGDIALLVDDVDRARALWNSVGGGPFTRLAAARLCDALGNCLTGTRVANTAFRFDPLDDGGLPDVAADEVLLRHARVLAYDGRLDDAVTLLVERGERACTRARPLCRRLALEALRSAAEVDDDENRDHAAAVALAVTLGVGDDAASVELAARGAEWAAAAGAPRFAADLLSSTTAIAKEKKESTLLRAAELYLEAGDDVRAALILRYLHARPMKKPLALRWQQLATRIGDIR